MQSSKKQTRPCERSVGRVLRFFDSFQRKFDFESRAFRFGRERFYRSAVKIDDVFRYRETQSDAARRPRFFRAIESVEDMRQVFVGDYRTAIIYRKHCFCSVFGKVYANFAALRFVLYHIIDEYHKQPALSLRAGRFTPRLLSVWSKRLCPTPRIASSYAQNLQRKKRAPWRTRFFRDIFPSRFPARMGRGRIEARLTGGISGQPPFRTPRLPLYDTTDAPPQEADFRYEESYGFRI